MGLYNLIAVLGVCSLGAWFVWLFFKYEERSTLSEFQRHFPGKCPNGVLHGMASGIPELHACPEGMARWRTQPGQEDRK